MKMTMDLDLLQEYAQRGSEKAFAELVARHLDLVYSAALRQVKSSQLAEDVAQSVFTDLARNVHQLKPDTVLAAWLYQVTRRTALNVSRAEGRRQAREQIAVELADMNANSSDWTQIEPWLDEAMETLDEPDRAAILLRYFENKSLRHVGETLGVGEDAAQKRVSRAVERLREFFSKRNVTIGTSGLVVLISTNAVQAAPIGLAVLISNVALLGIATSATITTMNLINAKLMTAVVISALVAGTGTYLTQHAQANRLRSENQQLQLQYKKLSNEQVALSPAIDMDSERVQKEKRELLRLRSEVGLLRQQKNEAERLREENQRLQAALAKPEEPAQQLNPEAEKQKEVATGKMSDVRNLVMGMILLADKKGEFPKSINDILAYSGGDSKITSPDSFELVYVGPLSDIKSLSTTIVIREKEAWDYQGKRRKSYGFADGHSEIKTEPKDGFETWEKEHMMPQTSP
ncbi:MAG: sigma-70 family RNA polymerase sigma factor [Verrucomicrobiota bacterium]